MIAVDTNVLVRFFVRDDEKQYQQAVKLLESCEDSGESVYISNIVLTELVWVLKGGYKVSKEDIIKTISMLLTSSQFKFVDSGLIRDALASFQSGSADFADYLIGHEALGHDARTTFTFDKRCGRERTFSLIN
ncbi:MAG: type II toxin-antitoxin system VapC family toxin [Candidatus Marinimicrobia bacterium]|nr:type II toxin-antitoxin system VapC family toxin [Candidatus Neomarinimicrobiota bacterium]